MRIPVLALLSAAAIAAPATASAATTIDGTLAASISRVRSSTGLIGDGSVFTNRSAQVDDGVGSFDAVLDGDLTITLSSITATLGSVVSFSSAFGSYTGSITSVDTQAAGAGRTVTLVSLGTFTPSGTLSQYSAGAASITFSFTQTGGSGTAVSGSFSLASPPTGVPEPMSWSLLVTGAGFAGAALRRSRKKAVVAVA